MAGMERKTPDAMEAWDKAFRVRAPETARVVGLSNLEGVPFFVPKNSIKKALVKQMPDAVVLCDWKGKVYPELGFPKGATISVGVFDASGDRLGIVNGPVTDEKLTKFWRCSRKDRVAAQPGSGRCSGVGPLFRLSEQGPQSSRSRNCSTSCAWL